MISLQEIIQHAKYNAVVFTGLDTEDAQKNTEYEVRQIKALVLETVQAAKDELKDTDTISDFDNLITEKVEAL
jgi:hypothetical protein